MVYALSVFLVNLILKFLPDNVVPFQLGPDSVYDRRVEAKKTQEAEPTDEGNAINN